MSLLLSYVFHVSSSFHVQNKLSFLKLMQFKFCLKNFMVKKQDIIEVKIEA